MTRVKEKSLVFQKALAQRLAGCATEVVEYKVVHEYEMEVVNLDESDGQTSTRVLSDLARQGWRVIACVSSQFGAGCTLGACWTLQRAKRRRKK